MSTLPRLRRTLLSLSFALAVAAVPISQVAACSCAVGETADVIRGAQLAFIGTVADQRDTDVQNVIGGEMREYAFVVARANVPTDAITRVVAGTGDASCGITFANDEEWLILARRTPAGLETNLCSGNLLMTDIDAMDRAAIVDLLPAGPSTAPEPSEEPAELPAEPSAAAAEPSAAPAVSEETSPDVGERAVPLLVGGLAILLLAGVGLLAFSRRRSR